MGLWFQSGKVSIIIIIILIIILQHCINVVYYARYELLDHLKQPETRLEDMFGERVRAKHEYSYSHLHIDHQSTNAIMIIDIKYHMLILRK